MSFNKSRQALSAEMQSLHQAREQLLRLLIAGIQAYGWEDTFSLSAAAMMKLDLTRLALDVFPTDATQTQYIARVRDLRAEPTPNYKAPSPEPGHESGPTLVVDAAEAPAFKGLPHDAGEPRDVIQHAALPCACSHEKGRHVGGIGRCGEGTCDCEGYDGGDDDDA